jgi:hypothetical protein
MAYGALVPLFGHCIRISYHLRSASMHAHRQYYMNLALRLFCAVLTVNDGGDNNVKGQ